MSHCYSFYLDKRLKTSSVYFSYQGERVIPNDIIEQITILLLSKAATLWFQNNAQCMDDSINLRIFKQELAKDGKTVELEWLQPFNNLSMRNADDNDPATTIYIQFHWNCFQM